MTSNEKKVIVAMSGGVDSSVTAVLLQQQGYQIVGVTLEMQQSPSADTPSDTVAQARAVAQLLGVPHIVLNCHQDFERKVLHHCWAEYSDGRTPNPCVVCNPNIKFGYLLDYAQQIGARWVATGHYARVDHSLAQPRLLRGVDKNKDQSYFLCGLSQQQLQQIIMPLGGYRKPEVRDLAKTMGLPNATRAESQDACFVSGDDSLAHTLQRRFGATPTVGDIVDTNGTVLGQHRGLQYYTIGQRRGLGIALGRKAYVVEIDAAQNRVVLSAEESDLFASGLRAQVLNWYGSNSGQQMTVEAQVRYRHAPAVSSVTIDQRGQMEVRFETPQRAVAPGQAVVFYDGDEVLGGGLITGAL